MVRDFPRFWVDRRPIAVLALFNGSWPGVAGISENNASEWGLNPHWRQGGVPWLIGQLNLLYRKGYRRFMLSLPAGRPNVGRMAWPSAQWHVLNDSGILHQSGNVQKDLQMYLTPWLGARPDVQVLIYMGFQIDSPYDRDMTNAYPPDIDNPDHLSKVKENTEGWLALSPDPTRKQIGFGLDHSGPWPNLLALLAEYFLEQGIFVTGEAIPMVATPPSEFAFRVPWFGLMQFHQNRDPSSSWCVDPWRSHLGFGVHNRECETGYRRPGGICPEEHFLEAHEIHSAIQSAHERGFVIFCYGRIHDDFVLDLTRGLTSDCSLEEECLTFEPKVTRVRQEFGRWKVVSGATILKDFGTRKHLARKAVEIIKYYGFNRRCWLNYPGTSFEYYLVGNSAPEGSFGGENCIAFDPRRIVVRRSDGAWKIVEGTHTIQKFASFEEAWTTYRVIRKYDFTNLCSVGRRKPSMIYLRR